MDIDKIKSEIIQSLLYNYVWELCKNFNSDMLVVNDCDLVNDNEMYIFIDTELKEDDFNNYDIIVCFDEENYRDLNRMFNSSSKIIKLLSYDIDDPWYTGDFDGVYRQLYEAIENLQQKNKGFLKTLLTVK